MENLRIAGMSGARIHTAPQCLLVIINPQLLDHGGWILYACRSTARTSSQITRASDPFARIEPSDVVEWLYLS